MSKRPLSSSPSTSPTVPASEISLPAQASPLSQSTTLASSPPADKEPQVTPPRQSSSSSGSQIPESQLEPQPESQPETEPLHNPMPASWVMPTSGELAFLTSLPAPTVRLADDDASPQISESPATQSTTTVSQEPGGVDVPAPEQGDIFSAASRAWTGTIDGRVFHRRDTWAVGNRWGRHVRVIEVGNGTSSGGKGESSC